MDSSFFFDGAFEIIIDLHFNEIRYNFRRKINIQNFKKFHNEILI